MGEIEGCNISNAGDGKERTEGEQRLPLDWIDVHKIRQ
jgi:hypothetical protein